MMRCPKMVRALGLGMLVAFPQMAEAVKILEYNFAGGQDGALVSGNTGGASAGTLDSSVDHPNTLLDSVSGGTLTVSRIKHWSDTGTTETSGGNFVGLTYDTSLPPGAETRVGYDGQAVKFTRSGVLHESSEVAGSNTAFTAFSRIYWNNASLSNFETLFANGSFINQAGSWWVGIVGGKVTWDFKGSPGMTMPTTGPALTANTWTDVAVTFNGNGGAPGADTLKVYIDGTLHTTVIGETSFTPTVGSLRDDWSFWPAANPLTSSLQLGGSFHGVPAFKPDEFVGLMERFVYFNNTLTDAEVRALTVPVPEPSAVTIVLLGGAALLARRKRSFA